MFSAISDIFRYIFIFKKYLGNKIIIIFFVALFASIAEGFGILLLFPLFETLDGFSEKSAEDSVLSSGLFWVITVLGLSPDTSSVLLVIAVSFILKGLFTWLALGYNAFLFGALIKTLKGQLFDAYTSMTYSYYSMNTTGHFVNLINEQPTKAVESFKQLTLLLSNTVNTLVLIFLAFYVTYFFGLIALAVGVVLLLIFTRLNSYVRKLSRFTATETSVLNGWLIQTLHAFKYLTATGQTKILGKNVYHSIDRLTSFAIRQGIASAFTKAVREPIAVIFITLILFYQLVVTEQAFEPIIVALVLFYRALNSIIGIQSGFQGAFQFVGSMELVDSELTKLNRNRAEPGSQEIGAFNDGIEFRNVSFKYSEQEEYVLENTSLLIPVNTSVALVGESGSGKSTIADLVSLVLEPTEGKVFIDGVSSGVIEKYSWRHQVGYVSQETVIFDDTIGNNISMWAKDKSSEETTRLVKEAAAEANILQFIEGLPLGFDTLVGDRGVLLSGGQRQRLFVARELFRKPRLLILDEATSALDSASEKEIQNSIDELSGKTTLLIIAHRLSTIKNVDLIYVLKDGALDESGTYEELVSDSSTSFSKLVSMQSLEK